MSPLPNNPLPTPIEFLSSIANDDIKRLKRLAKLLTDRRNACFDRTPVPVDREQQLVVLLDILRAVQWQRTTK